MRQIAKTALAPALPENAPAADRPQENDRAHRVVVDTQPANSRRPARLELLQNLSGLVLALLLVTHMLFVATILISHELFYSVARFFEGGWLFGEPQPALVSMVAAGVTGLLVAHAWLAMRKIPAGYRQVHAFSGHRRRLRYGDTSLWWLQAMSGFALFFLTTIHLYDMVSQPQLIGPYESAERVWTGGMWPIYLALLFTAEVHGGIALYRLAVKWGWFADTDADAGRRRLRRIRHAFSTFFITLGLVTLLAYIDLGRAHADRGGERYALPGHVAVGHGKP